MIFSKRNLLEKVTPTFTRASSATYIDSVSGIVTVASNELRETELGYLLEKDSTNLLTYSEGNAATYPQKGGVQDAATSINGFDNSIEFYQSGVTTYAYKVFATPTNNYAISVFVEMDDGLAPVVGDTIFTGDFCLVIDNTSGIVTSGLKVEYAYDNVYRVSGVKIPNGTGQYNGIAKWSGQSARTFRIAGIQLEQLNYVTSYIKTEASTVTRAADSFIYSLTTLPQELQIKMDFIPIANGSDYSNFRLLGTDDSSGTLYEITTANSPSAYSFTANAEGGGVVNLLDSDITLGTASNWIFTLTTESSNTRCIIQKDGVTKLNTTYSHTLNHSNQNELQIGRFNTEYASGFYSNLNLFSKD